jgi:hypothetical protein
MILPSASRYSVMPEDAIHCLVLNNKQTLSKRSNKKKIRKNKKNKKKQKFQ